VADFLLGTFSSLFLDFGVGDNDDVSNAPSFFSQDEFKATPRLTLTLGVRYEPYLFWYDNHDRIDTVESESNRRSGLMPLPEYFFRATPVYRGRLLPQTRTIWHRAWASPGTYRATARRVSAALTEFSTSPSMPIHWRKRIRPSRDSAPRSTAASRTRSDQEGRSLRPLRQRVSSVAPRSQRSPDSIARYFRCPWAVFSPTFP
jgi:hypothetical protein